jgi:hypothetical protein
MSRRGPMSRQEKALRGTHRSGGFARLILIERVRAGRWNPDSIKSDQNHRGALAARGYWQAFKSVRKSVEKVLRRVMPDRLPMATTLLGIVSFFRQV